MENKTHVAVTLKDNRLFLYEGEAPEILQPKGIHHHGNISTVGNYLLGGEHWGNVAFHECLLIVDREAGRITLYENQKQSEGLPEHRIKSELSFHPDLEGFQIRNKGKWANPVTLSNHFKFNRRLFVNRTTNAELVTAFKNYKATVTSDIENEQDDRGSRRHLQDRKVKTNFPEVFQLNCRVFKGEDPVTFEVEVCIQPRDNGVTIWLQSVELEEYIEERTNEIIDRELARIADLNITVIEQ